MIHHVDVSVDKRTLTILTIFVALFFFQNPFGKIFVDRPNDEVRTFNEQAAVHYRLHSVDTSGTIHYEQR